MLVFQQGKQLPIYSTLGIHVYPEQLNRILIYLAALYLI
jgi:hypothetical protein